MTEIADKSIYLIPQHQKPKSLNTQEVSTIAAIMQSDVPDAVKRHQIKELFTSGRGSSRVTIKGWL